MNLLHRVGIRLGASVVIEFAGIAIESGNRRDVGLLARRGGFCCVRGQLFCVGRLAEAALDDGRVGLIPELMPHTHCDSPMRHGAVRIAMSNAHEFLFRLFVPEGVEQRDAAGERLLHRRGAGDGEMHRAQLRGGEIFVVMVLVVIGESGVGEGGERGQRKQQQRRHAKRCMATPRMDVIRILVMGRLRVKRAFGWCGYAVHKRVRLRLVTPPEGTEFGSVKVVGINVSYTPPPSPPKKPKIFILLELRARDRDFGCKILSCKDLYVKSGGIRS